jgi:hypothetical protein
MALPPILLPEWASQDQNDPVTGAPNKVEPTASFKLSGVNRNEALIRPYLNYELDLISDWIEFFRDSDLSGTESTVSSQAVVTIPDQGNTTYQVIVTPKANLGNVWVTNDSSTQFTINVSSGDGNVDWLVKNKL